MADLIVHQLLVLQDNYAYLVHDEASGATVVIDPSMADPVLEALKARRWKASCILNTHHHHDHVGGNLDLKRATGCTIVGSRVDAARVPGLDLTVGDGDVHTIGTMEITILEIPGHTRGHLALWFKEQGMVFTGDTLFTLGCGRLFEGTPEIMWQSLCRLRELPEQTQVYCGHEYTQANARFALTVDGENERLRARATRTDTLRGQGRATVPSRLEEERATNPFLRADCRAIQRALNLEGAQPVKVFAELRRRKDVF